MVIRPLVSTITRIRLPIPQHTAGKCYWGLEHDVYQILDMFTLHQSPPRTYVLHILHACIHALLLHYTMLLYEVQIRSHEEICTYSFAIFGTSFVYIHITCVHRLVLTSRKTNSMLFIICTPLYCTVHTARVVSHLQ